MEHPLKKNYFRKTVMDGALVASNEGVSCELATSIHKQATAHSSKDSRVWFGGDIVFTEANLLIGCPYRCLSILIHSTSIQTLI